MAQARRQPCGRSHGASSRTVSHAAGRLVPAVCGAAAMVLWAGCQAVGPIPPAPVATPIRPAESTANATGSSAEKSSVESAGSAAPRADSASVAAAPPGLNDPAALEARIRQLVAELEATRAASQAGGVGAVGRPPVAGESPGAASALPPPAVRFESQGEQSAADQQAVLAAAREAPAAEQRRSVSEGGRAGSTAGPAAVRIEVGGPASVASGPAPAVSGSAVKAAGEVVSSSRGGAGEASTVAAAAGGQAGSNAMVLTNQPQSVEARGPLPAVSVSDVAGAGGSADAGTPSAGWALPGVAAGGTTGVEALVARRVERDPRDVSAQLDAALLAYLREEPSPNAAAIAGLAQEDREIIAAAVDALVNFRAAVRSDPNLMYAARVRPFAELSDRLRLRSELAVPVVAMASRVDSFGVYEPMPQVISTRSETVTVLYTEVANFTSRLTEQRQWETRLSAELGLFDAGGRRVWSFRPPLKVDLCRNRRTDFFISYLVRIPPQPAGRYVLKVTVTDENVGRVAEGLMPLESK